MTCPPEDLQYVYAGFAEILLDIPADIPAIFNTWEKMGRSRFFRMMSVEESLARYLYLEKVMERRGRGTRLADCDKHQVYQLISCPCDARERPVMDLLADYMRAILIKGRTSLQFPMLDEENPELQTLESYYKCLDLYHQVSRRFGFPYEKHGLDATKKVCVERINAILTADTGKSAAADR